MRRPRFLLARTGNTWSNLYQRREMAMGERTQRAEGKMEEAKGRLKQTAGRATGRGDTEARGVADDVKGKAKDAVGKVRSVAKRNTR
jgi:uncharacterized protein YjbJ (UPF0337 family)